MSGTWNNRAIFEWLKKVGGTPTIGKELSVYIIDLQKQIDALKIVKQ